MSAQSSPEQLRQQTAPEAGARPKPHLATLLLATLFILYAGGRVLTTLPALENPVEFPDTRAYLRVAGQPIWDADFWGSTRPLVFPLLLKLAGRDFVTAAAYQLSLSIVAWCLLAWMVARSLSGGRLQVFGAALILALSLDRHIAAWDFAMLTESLSISLLALLVALGIWLLHGWQAGKVVLVCLAALLLAFTRDTNAWLLLFLAGLLLVAALLRYVGPRAVVLAGLFAAIFLLSNANADFSARWVFPLVNVMGRRVLPDPAAVAFFEACGMPVSQALLDAAGNFANDDERALMDAPELEAFRSWLWSHGKGCYARWLGWRASAAAQEVWSEFDFLVGFSRVDNFFAKRYDPLMPVSAGRLLYLESGSRWIWVGVTIAALWAVWNRRWQDNVLWAAVILITLTIFPHLFLAWHGDAMAPQRHALSVGVQLYLALWLTVLLFIEGYMLRKTGANQ